MTSNTVFSQLYRAFHQHQCRISTASARRNILRSNCCHRHFATSAGALTLGEKMKALESLSKNGPFRWQSIDDRDAIMKTYEFADFKQAWSFMSKSAQLAEEMDHHPEWFNVYNRVEVTLTTHDCNGVSEKVCRFA